MNRSTAAASGKIRVVIVEDHPITCAGIRNVLQAQPEMEVVGEAGSVAEALEAIGVCRPRVVLLDLRLPDGSGMDIVRWIRRHALDVHIVFLSAYMNAQYITAAMRHGAQGYLSKEAPPEELVAAVRAITAGHPFWVSGESRLRSQTQHQPGLTKREQQVLELLGTGLQNREIARALNRAVSTVEDHITHIMEKLSVRSRTELILKIHQQEDPKLMSP